MIDIRNSSLRNVCWFTTKYRLGTNLDASKIELRFFPHWFYPCPETLPEKIYWDELWSIWLQHDGPTVKATRKGNSIIISPDSSKIPHKGGLMFYDHGILTIYNYNVSANKISDKTCKIYIKNNYVTSIVLK